MKSRTKKFCSWFSILFLVVSLLAACGSPKQTEVKTENKTSEAKAQSYKSGTYNATSYGYLSDITVETTFSDSEITGIKVIKQDESPEMFSYVDAQVPGDIVKHQSLAVDTVSGATMSSMAVINAVSQTVEQAGGDASALRKVAIEKKPGKDEEYKTDVVVVGLGASGFMAAHNAALSGVEVMAVEKSAAISMTNGLKVSGPFAVGTPVLEAQDSKLTVDKAFNYMMDYTYWGVNAPLIRRSLETSDEAVTQLMDIGYEFEEADFRFDTIFKGEYGGFHLIKTPKEERWTYWEDTIEKDGIDVLFNTTGKKLMMNGEDVVGIEAQKKDGTKVTIHADAVILATGGFIGNKEMIDKYYSGAQINAAGGTLSTGDGINMALEAGAVMDKTFGLCLSEYGGTNAKASRNAKQDKYDQNTAFKFGVYGGLFVDAQGKRFMNEGMMVDYPMSFGSEPILRNSPYYAVVDQAYVDAMATKGLYEYTVAKGAKEDWVIGNYYKGKVLTNLNADIEEGIKEGWTFKADTIEELGKLLGLENLKETVDTYNGYVEIGKDPIFGKDPMYLSSVKEGPFYIVENQPSGWTTFGGIRVDSSLRALNSDNEAVQGLYVVGTDAGSLFSSPYYDVPGSAYGLSIDSGNIAGKESAAYAKEHVMSDAENKKSDSTAKPAATAKKSDGMYTDGTYTAKAVGNGGDVKVEVVIDGGKINEVNILESSETPDMITSVEDTLIPSIIEAQGTEGVDAVSGASNTSKAVLDAVNQAIEQAGK